MIGRGPSVTHLAEFVNGNAYKPEDFGDSGVPVVRIRQLLDPSAELDLAPVPARPVWLADGDLVFSWSATLAVRFWDRGKALLNQHLFRVDVHPWVDRRWFAYALEEGTKRLEPLMHGSAMTHITRDMLKSVTVPLPPIETQRAIADYLDSETRRIDALVAAKRKLMTLLAERQSALTTELLLGPPVPGGGAGAGQVKLRPGWSLVPFRRLFREVDLRSDTGAETLLSVSQTRGVIPQADLGDRRQHAHTLVGYKLCKRGDLVVNRMWVYFGALGAAPQPGIVSPDYAVFRPTAEMSSEFAAYVLRTPSYVGEMTRLVRGIGAAFQGTVRKPRLHPSELGLIEMPVAPAREQETLLHTLDEQTHAISNQVSLIERSGRLLEERRQALVMAAVTGELDVPGDA